MKKEDTGKKAYGNDKPDLPNDPKKHIPVKPDKDPDPTKKKPNEPEKNDPTRIDDPEKIDPTRIEQPPSSRKE
jgi:hypothetical protein